MLGIAAVSVTEEVRVFGARATHRRERNVALGMGIEEGGRLP
jgi:hypothetical protein